MRPVVTAIPLAIVASALVAVAGADSAGTTISRSALPLLTYVASNGGICLVRADGSHPVRLTPRWQKVGGAAWSPGGRYLAFGRQTSSDGQSKIVVANVRGKIRWHFGAGQFNGSPLWSPDGRHIAYFAAQAHVYGLEVARLDGSDDHGVAASPGFPSYGPDHPAWTPDDQRLAFDDGSFFSSTMPQGIYTVALDGSDRLLLIAGALSPAFSPDGKRLAYVAFHYSQQHGVNEQGGIFIAAADGTNPHLLAAQTGQLSWSTPAWSPDGKYLAFRRDRLLNGRAVHTDLVVARADASGERVLASAPSSVGLSPPVWSPGGKYLAFVRNTNGAIVVARADGGGQRVVVARSVGGLPAWRPAVAQPAARRPSCPRR